MAPSSDERRPGSSAEQAVGATARAGFAARAVLYGIIGLLALQLGLGVPGSDDTDQQGAMAALASQPLGGLLLAALALGLAGYAVFRGLQAVRGRGRGGVLQRRVVPAVRAVVYAVLSLLAVQELVGAGGDRQEESRVTAWVLALPGGTWIVGGVGLVVAGVGLQQLVKAWTGDVNELARPGSMPRRLRRVVRIVGRLGHLGRGAVYLLGGGFLVRAAVLHDPKEGVGLDAALQEVLDAPFGTPLLVAMALGLLLFGLHCAVEARYAR